MKNLKKIFSLLCLSAMITSEKVDAGNLSMIAGSASVLLGLFNFSLGLHSYQIVDPALPEEKRKGAKSGAVIRAGIGILEMSAGVATLVDEFMISKKNLNTSETNK